MKYSERKISQCILPLRSRFCYVLWSSHLEVLLWKGVLKICNKFIEITLRHGCSPVNFLHIFRRPFLKNTSGWLLLRVMILRYAPNQILIASLISIIKKKAVDKNVVDYKITNLVHKNQFTKHVQQYVTCISVVSF